MEIQVDTARLDHSRNEQSLRHSFIISKRRVLQPNQTSHCELSLPEGIYLIEHETPQFQIPPTLIDSSSPSPIAPIRNKTSHVLTIQAGERLPASSTISDEIADMCYHDFIPSPSPSTKPLRDYFDEAHLNEADKKAIFTVIGDYPEVFLTDGKKLKCTDVMEFDVELDTDRPIARPPYPAPRGYEKDFDRLI